MKLLKIECAALFAFIICLFLSAYNLDRNCEGIRSEILRLHVIAASDSDEDQKIKLELRDELLKKGKEIFSESSSKEQAQKKISDNLSEIKKSADNYLESRDYPYRVDVRLEKSYFPTRKYEGFTLPAGYYDALRVIIGEGKGQNWWCVMFPALCLPAAKSPEAELDVVLSEKEKAIVSNKKYEVRLWFVEKLQELKKNFMYNN